MASGGQIAMLPNQESCVKVFWLPKEICQSHEEGESKACTLIAVLIVTNCHMSQVNFSKEIPSNQLINVFRKSIEQGNKMYRKLHENGFLKVKYLNVPEALYAVSSDTNKRVVEWGSYLYGTDMYKTMFTNMNGSLHKWHERKPDGAKSDLSVVILANLRAVVAVFCKKMGVVTLLDSHSHCTYGAVIALVPVESLENLCKWYAIQLAKDTGPIGCYELSFLYCR